MHVINQFVRLFVGFDSLRMNRGGSYACKHVTLSKTAVLELDSAAGCGLTRGTADAEALSAILGQLFGAAALTVIDRSTRLYFYHVSCDAPSRVPLFSFFLRKSFCFHFLLGFQCCFNSTL